MITVWASVAIADGNIAEALQISLEHVARSRGEPGCLSHNVSIDAENENCLNFHEEWVDLDALHEHFKVEASIQFAARITALATVAPEIRIFESTRVN